jgi:hypothetical protein
LPWFSRGKPDTFLQLDPLSGVAYGKIILFKVDIIVLNGYRISMGNGFGNQGGTAATIDLGDLLFDIKH